MQLAYHPQSGDDHVRSVAADRIVLASGERRTSFVIAAGIAAFDWPVTSIASLSPMDCEPIFALQPSVVILGTGSNQAFPTREVQAAFLTRRIGIEFMSNAAAARTYNVLLSEGRKVAAAFILG